MLLDTSKDHSSVRVRSQASKTHVTAVLPLRTDHGLQRNGHPIELAGVAAQVPTEIDQQRELVPDFTESENTTFKPQHERVGLPDSMRVPQPSVNKVCPILRSTAAVVSECSPITTNYHTAKSGA